MKTSFITIAALTLAGCATPVGQMPDSDFAWYSFQLGIGYQAAYRNLREGFKTCGTAYGILEGDLYTDIGEGKLTVYVPGAFLPTLHHNIVEGVIRIRGEAGKASSMLRIGVQHRYDRLFIRKPGDEQRSWAKLARGDFSDCRAAGR